MSATPRSRNRHSRVALTITLKPTTYDFVESCGQRRQFSSVDDLFEAALAIYKNHLEAVNAYVELESARGNNIDDAMRRATPEIVFTRPSPRRK
jgi:hypothetical protein